MRYLIIIPVAFICTLLFTLSGLVNIQYSGFINEEINQVWKKNKVSVVEYDELIEEIDLTKIEEHWPRPIMHYHLDTIKPVNVDLPPSGDNLLFEGQ
jgi:hypothetical protein